MSDETAFLRAVAENPTDATAKLAYADWLDEHGEPDRAAYLRLLATAAPDPDRKRELETRVGGSWRGWLHVPLPQWDSATFYALGRLEGALETYRLFNERTSDLVHAFCTRLVPKNDTIEELWRPRWLPTSDTFAVEQLGDWEASLASVLGRWLFVERASPRSRSDLTIETEAGRASAVGELMERVRDVLSPHRGWQVRFEPSSFYALDWTDLALEATDRVLFLHFSVTD